MRIPLPLLIRTVLVTDLLRVAVARQDFRLLRDVYIQFVIVSTRCLLLLQSVTTDLRIVDIRWPSPLFVSLITFLVKHILLWLVLNLGFRATALLLNIRDVRIDFAKLRLSIALMSFVVLP